MHCFLNLHQCAVEHNVFEINVSIIYYRNWPEPLEMKNLVCDSLRWIE